MERNFVGEELSNMTELTQDQYEMKSALPLGSDPMANKNPDSFFSRSVDGPRDGGSGYPGSLLPNMTFFLAAGVLLSQPC